MSEDTTFTQVDLDPIKKRAAMMLSVGFDFSDIKEKIGVNRITLVQWLKDPIFIDELNSYYLEIELLVKSRIYHSARLASVKLADSLLDSEGLEKETLATCNLSLQVFGQYEGSVKSSSKDGSGLGGGRKKGLSKATVTKEIKEKLLGIRPQQTNDSNA